MINRLIELSLRNRFIVTALVIALAGWGWWAVRATPIDAIPDLSDNQVIVFTDWPGHGPQEVEDQITYPMTVSLQGLAGVRVVRSQSAFGFSMIYAVFEDHVDLYFARARVLERMSLVAKVCLKSWRWRLAISALSAAALNSRLNSSLLHRLPRFVMKTHSVAFSIACSSTSASSSLMGSTGAVFIVRRVFGRVST